MPFLQCPNCHRGLYRPAKASNENACPRCGCHWSVPTERFRSISLSRLREQARRLANDAELGQTGRLE